MKKERTIPIPKNKYDYESIIPLVMPDDGVTPVLDFIRSAKDTLLVKQFSFTDPDILHEIIEAHNRGVVIHVMLNERRPDRRQENLDFRKKLEDVGISVSWTNPHYRYSHEKTMVADGERALISTFNLNPKHFVHTRDYGVIINSTPEVADIIACFTADWMGTGFNPAPETNLFWSGHNSRLKTLEFLDSATQTIDIQHPKLVDTTIIERLLEAYGRGVKIRFLCGGKKGLSDYTLRDTLASFRLLKKFGIPVFRINNGLRLHTKFILVDGKLGLISSMNLCRNSFEHRREIGMFFKKCHALDRFRETFEKDWGTGIPWDIPDAITAIEIKREDEDRIDDPEYTDE